MQRCIDIEKLRRRVRLFTRPAGAALCAFVAPPRELVAIGTCNLPIPKVMGPPRRRLDEWENPPPGRPQTGRAYAAVMIATTGAVVDGVSASFP